MKAVCFRNWGEQDIPRQILFSDEATFHPCGTLNNHNCHVWVSNNPHDDVTEHERDW